MNGIAPSANAQYNGVPLDPPPSVRQGFGRANLGYSLPLAGSGLGWNLQVAFPVVLHGLAYSDMSSLLTFIDRWEMLPQRPGVGHPA